jgi:hypothetical protein
VPAAAQPWDGNGVEGDPYLIYDACDMQQIGADSVYWDAHFKLMADIDLSGYTGESFNIIGTSTLHRFTGVFDGDEHTISNFTFTTHSRNILGIFGYLGELFAGGQVRDLGLINPSVSTDTGDKVGALAGHLYYGQVINCWVEGGDVSGDQSVGGLVGYVYGGGDVEDCYYDGVVSGGSQVGGLVGGVNGSVSVWGCYSTGSVDGYLYVGGLVGRGMGSIVNSYSMSDVSGSSGVGGLVGYNHYCDVLNCYSVGSVAGSSEVGGLVGKYYDGMTYGSYWDVLTSGQASSGGGTGKTTAELQTASTFIGWGCSSVWTIDEDNDYPRLVWENKPGELITDPAYWTGSGTEADPYLIYTTEELNLIGQVRCMWDKHFKLMADIDLGSFAGAEFNIIGSLHSGIFTGVFEGNGKRISNFTYSCSNHNGIGLFRAVGLGGEVKNLELEEPNIDAGTGWNVGALAGYVYQGSLFRCGSNNGGVSGNGRVGGLVGWHRETNSSSCFSSGSVSGVEEVGGFAGRHYEGEISNSYSEGSVTGDAKVGGFVGYNYKYDSPSWIRECYSAGGIFGNSDVGGLVGYDDGGSYVKSFWDSDVNPDVNGIGSGTDPNVISESTANMQTESTFTDAGWDFTTPIWTICEGEDYPRLAWEKYGGGNGTEATPYLIRTSCQMNAIGADSNDWDAHFKLMADIDLGGYTGADFNIIGSGWDEPFTGVFDGNGYKIYNFSYGPIASDSYVGIFGMVYGANAEIKNLGLINPNIDVGAFMTGGLVGRLVQGIMSGCYVEGGSVTGDGFVGALAGGSGFVNATISNCYAKTSVSGDWPVGGLVGMNNGTVSDCYATGNVVGNSRIGGLVGANEELAIVSHSYASGIIQGADDAGGLAGRNWGGTISNCYATGNVSGDSSTGGLVGQNAGANGYTATISNSYAVGDVTGYYNAGGLVGWNVGFLDPAEITNCYSVGGVSGDTSIGGLIGANLAGSVVDSFWDKTTSGQESSSGGTPKTTTEMQTENTFTDAGWDFVGEVINGPNDIWDICEGTNYPKFVWQIPAADFVCPDGVEMRDFAVLGTQWQLEELSADVAPDGGDGFVNLLDWVIFADGWQTIHDIFDLAEFADQWLKTGSSYLIADIAPVADGDGIVNVLDFAALADNWLTGI